MIEQTQLPFKLELTKNNLTAHSGLALLAEYHKSLGLTGLINRHLPTPGSHRGYKASVFVNSLVLMLQAGGRTLEDLRELKYEEGLMNMLEQDNIPEADSTGDWLRRMGEPKRENEGLNGLDKVNREIVARLLRRDGIKEYTLDADATEIVSDKRDARKTYKGNFGYMPMLGFLYERAVCIYDEFREGNVSPATDQKGFYLECKKRMPKGKRIGYYRADKASYQAALINQLESDKVKYAIAAIRTEAVMRAVSKIREEYWQKGGEYGQYEVANIRYGMEDSEHVFRLVAKREKKIQKELFDNENGYVYHTIATNFDKDEKTDDEVMQWYNERGNAENYNKELKIGFGMERMPCGQSYANAVFFRIGVLAYNLFIGFKHLTCPSEWLKHTIQTFRWKVVNIAGEIIHHARQVILRIRADEELLKMFERIRGKVGESAFGYG